jgi:NADPH:quinone reductase-like Zn-dependent oxidoreductase
MKAAMFESFGEPADVLEIRDVPVPEPGPGEVRVRMIASPINPSDLMVVRGRYGVLPRLPAVPGFEGVGIVDKAGPGLLGRWVQDRRVVAINQSGGNWAEYAVIPARQARPLAADIPDEQGATFFINPASVLALVRHILQVPRGEWLLQSAAGSTLGKMIIKLGRHDGFKTLNLVRRSEAKEALNRLGADAVISSSEGPIESQVKQIAGLDGVRFALDPIGGETGTAVLRSLGQGGRLILYGSLSGDPIQLHPRQMIAGRKVVEGFWLGHWMRGRSIPSNLLLFREIAALLRNGVLTSEIGPSYPLQDVKQAVRQAETVGRDGKVLLTIAPPSGG